MGIFNMFSSIHDDSPAAIERKNLEFYKETNQQYDEFIKEFNVLLNNKNSKTDYKVSVIPVKQKIETHVNKIRVEVIVGIKLLLEWKSERDFIYSSWYETNLINIKLNHIDLINFIYTNFVEHTMKEWKENDKYRIK